VEVLKQPISSAGYLQESFLLRKMVAENIKAIEVLLELV
jgi:hypothetical protein